MGAILQALSQSAGAAGQSLEVGHGNPASLCLAAVVADEALLAPPFSALKRGHQGLKNRQNH